DLKIEHCLCAKEGTKYEDISDVYSHPQALSQCNNFLKNFDFTGINFTNTAAAAKFVAESNKNDIAVICSELAAKKYGLKILKRNVQNNNNNRTRFIVISKELIIDDNADKISLIFSAPHTTGSLYRVLGRFSMAGLSLTKLESRPIENQDFNYHFYVDVMGSVRDNSTLDLMCALYDELPEFEFLGNFFESR
ncbi:MAG: bifunctional chorismate mutase/prephenate dehydratase, partial [Eubacterium sp.]|nr:bifunctional chorismate mutase/prephenate dehydratase [Eubacterium sp.]